MLFQVIVCFGAAYFDPLFFGARICDVLPVLSKELDEQVLVLRVEPLFSLRCLLFISLVASVRFNALPPFAVSVVPDFLCKVAVLCVLVVEVSVCISIIAVQHFV